MEHTIGKNLFKMFVNLHLIINKNRNQKPRIISHTFPLAISCTISRKQYINFGNQGVHILMAVPSFIRLERGSDGGP